MKEERWKLSEEPYYYTRHRDALVSEPPYKMVFEDSFFSFGNKTHNILGLEGNISNFTKGR